LKEQQLDIIQNNLENGEKGSIFAGKIGLMKELGDDISKNGITKENLKNIEKYGEDIIEERAQYGRYNVAEIPGLKVGGRIHAEASIVAGRENQAMRGASVDAIAEQQEADIEVYARAKELWIDHTEEYLEKKYGEPIDYGEESTVYDNGKTVIKTKNTLQYFRRRKKMLPADGKK